MGGADTNSTPRHWLLGTPQGRHGIARRKPNLAATMGCSASMGSMYACRPTMQVCLPPAGTGGQLGSQRGLALLLVRRAQACSACKSCDLRETHTSVLRPHKTHLAAVKDHHNSSLITW